MLHNIIPCLTSNSVKGFQEFFTDFNKSLMPDAIPPPFRKPLTVKVIQVAGIEVSLTHIGQECYLLLIRMS